MVKLDREKVETLGYFFDQYITSSLFEHTDIFESLIHFFSTSSLPICCVTYQFSYSVHSSSRPKTFKSLQSIKSVKFERVWWLLKSRAFQLDPSLSSPSPTMANTRAGLFFICRARAIPTPIGKPCPRDPVEASTPGIIPRSGCPPKDEIFWWKVSRRLRSKLPYPPR